MRHSLLGYIPVQGVDHVVFHRYHGRLEPAKVAHRLGGLAVTGWTDTTIHLSGTCPEWDSLTWLTAGRHAVVSPGGGNLAPHDSLLIPLLAGEHADVTAHTRLGMASQGVPWQGVRVLGGMEDQPVMEVITDGRLTPKDAMALALLSARHIFQSMMTWKKAGPTA